jgi:hypothetical protein
MTTFSYTVFSKKHYFFGRFVAFFLVGFNRYRRYRMCFALGMGLIPILPSMEQEDGVVVNVRIEICFLCTRRR